MEKISFIFFIVSTIFLLSWTAVANDYAIFNKTLEEVLHISMAFGETILLLAVFTFSLSVVCLLNQIGIKLPWLKFCLFGKNFQTILCVVVVVAYLVIFAIWRPELQTVLLFFFHFAPIFQILFNVFAAVLLYCYGCKASNLKLKFLLLLFVVNLLFFNFSDNYPCVTERRLTKPKIFGHRGNIKSAPENTLFAFQMADKSGVDGYETDVAISYDGIPFLIHDRNLLRTTNIAQIFPDRMHLPAEAFTWNELQRLDAGSWYVHTDPYGTIRYMSEHEKEKIARQKIMSLSELAIRASKTKKMLIFDYRVPRVSNHPYMFNHVQVIVQVLQESGIDPRKVLWISGPHYQHVLSYAPDFVQVYGSHVSPELVKSRKLKMLILEYNDITPLQVQDYLRRDNLSMILYSSSTTWTFSLAWCEGAHTMISDDPTLHANMNSPMYLMSFRYYSCICAMAFFITLFILNVASSFFSWLRSF